MYRSDRRADRRLAVAEEPAGRQAAGTGVEMAQMEAVVRPAVAWREAEMGMAGRAAGRAAVHAVAVAMVPGNKAKAVVAVTAPDCAPARREDTATVGKAAGRAEVHEVAVAKVLANTAKGVAAATAPGSGWVVEAEEEAAARMSPHGSSHTSAQSVKFEGRCAALP